VYIIPQKNLNICIVSWK